MNTTQHLQEQLEALVTRAKKGGADEADSAAFTGTSFSLSCRLGKPENMDFSESHRIGLRVIQGKRQATVASNDLSPQTLEKMVDTALAIAKEVPEDPYCGIASPDQIARIFPEIDSFDSTELTPTQVKERVLACEDAALSISGVTSSEGAEGSWGKNSVVLVASNGFVGHYQTSLFSLGASVIAGKGAHMQRDAYGAAAVFEADLEDPKEVGRQAGERAVRRLNPRKVATGHVPVVYESLISCTLLEHFLGAIMGSEIAKKTSFLQDRLGEPLFSKGVHIIDDPLKKRGFASHPFDGEGLPTQPLHLVENGILKSWLLNLRASRQLGLRPTSHGTAALGGVPGISCSNLYMAPGTESIDSLLAPIDSGFFVTELLGFGVNSLTGDYSLGAGGFWIEKGHVTYPVSEVAIAGNLKEMFAQLTPADDLVFRGGINAPTVRIASMMVAGQ